MFELDQVVFISHGRETLVVYKDFVVVGTIVLFLGNMIITMFVVVD